MHSMTESAIISQFIASSLAQDAIQSFLSLSDGPVSNEEVVGDGYEHSRLLESRYFELGCMEFPWTH